MDATITSVDYAPGDLEAQVPFTAKLLRPLPGPGDRADYWLGELRRPLTWLREGTTLTISRIVLSSRYVGQTISPGLPDLVVGIAFVLDPAQLTLDRLQMSTCAYVAIGVALRVAPSVVQS